MKRSSWVALGLLLLIVGALSLLEDDSPRSSSIRTAEQGHVLLEPKRGARIRGEEDPRLPSRDEPEKYESAIHGVVYDPDQAPVKDCIVRLQHAGMLVSQFTTDSSGEFEFHVPDRQYSVLVESKSWGHIRVPKVSATDDLRLTFEGTAALTVELMGRDPLADEKGWLSLWCQRLDTSGPPSRLPMKINFEAAEANLSGLGLGRYSIRGRLRSSAYRTDFEVTKNGTQHVVAVNLDEPHEPGVIVGVAYLDGTALSNTDLSVSIDGGNIIHSVHTDARGVFEFASIAPVLGGQVVFSLAKPDERIAEVAVSIVSEAVVSLDIQFQRSNLKAQVTTSNGVPLSMTTVGVERGADDYSFHTDVDGIFPIGSLPNGTYDLVVGTVGGRVKVNDALVVAEDIRRSDETIPVVVDLPGAVFVEIRAFGGHEIETVKNFLAFVEVRQGDEVVSKRTVNTGGTLLIVDNPSGRWITSLEIRVREGRRHWGFLRIDEFENSDTWHVLDLRPFDQVEFQVKSSSGTPVRDLIAYDLHPGASRSECRCSNGSDASLPLNGDRALSRLAISFRRQRVPSQLNVSETAPGLYTAAIYDWPGATVVLCSPSLQQTRVVSLSQLKSGGEFSLNSGANENE